MDEVKEFIVIEEEEGDRLDVYLSEQLGDMSRSYIQKLIKDKKVTVNDKIEKAKYLVKEDDKIVIQIPAPKLLEVIPQDIPINIVYEDKDVLIVNKPQDMVVHPAPGNYEGTLVNKDGKNAITHFEVIKRYENFTHMKARLETGRTHQIRVHALSINHPLLGDEVYGPKNNKFKLKGQILHAKKLGFIHPTTKEYVEFDSELPKYFQDILNKLK